MSAGVSVIVAAWNAASTIDRCVQSVLSQRDVEVEVIVVNDASSDATAKILADLARDEPRLVVINRTQNGGPSAARNDGLARARFPWVAVVDGDDAIEPDRLAKMVVCAEETGADVVFDNMQMVDAATPDVSSDFLINDKQALSLALPWSLEQYVKNNRPYESDVLTGFLKPLFRTSFLQDHAIHYQNHLSNSEDFVLIATCLLHGAKIVYIHQALYRYFVYPSSLAGKFNQEAHAKLMAAEEEMLKTHVACMTDAARQALRGHIDCLHRAGITNALFGALRDRRLSLFLRLLFQDRKNAFCHIRRIVRSLVLKVTQRSNRGR